MAIALPRGFSLGGAYCGIKRNPSKLDISLILSDRPAVAAGVYTTNLVCAAPVTLDRERTPASDMRAIVVNSGNANACTGEQGLLDAKRMAELVAETVDISPEQTLVLSTGLIGELLPMEKIAAGISEASDSLGMEESDFINAARGMLTTDNHHKTAARTLSLQGKTIQLVGMSKGAAMIGPNMATMLGVVLTDAAIPEELAQAWLKKAADESFNCISVEGHMSTNDSVLFMANGAAEVGPSNPEEQALFQAALQEICKELALAIVNDGEGATHVIAIEVHGTKTKEDAATIAKTIATSALVKTAVTGADPNWGRFVSAAGYAGVEFDPRKVRLTVNGFLLYNEGAPVDFNTVEVSESMAANKEVQLVLTLKEGDASANHWTTDLTVEYVQFNADYHT